MSTVQSLERARARERTTWASERARLSAHLLDGSVETMRILTGQSVDTIRAMMADPGQGCRLDERNCSGSDAIL